MIIPERWRDIYAQAKAALRTEKDRDVRERMRRIVAGIETGKMERGAREMLRRLKSACPVDEIPAIEMLEAVYGDAPTEVLLRWHQFLGRLDEETGRRLVIAVGRREQVLPPDPAAYCSPPGHTA